jgi:Lipid A 3-O-deacylase (PagL)
MNRSPGATALHPRAVGSARDIRPRMRTLLACLLLLATRALAGEVSSEDNVNRIEKRRHWELSLESAQMVGADNRNRYYFSTQMLNLAWEPFPPLRLGPVRLRHQLMGTFFAAAILSRPESYYFGGGLQLRLIIPLGDTRFSLYANSGGGMGVADANEADKDDLGLGQDFTFILLAAAGLRYAISDRWSAWLGGMWHHLSNNDLSEPDKRNTGLDEFGVVLGAGYSF